MTLENEPLISEYTTNFRNEPSNILNGVLGNKLYTSNTLVNYSSIISNGILERIIGNAITNQFV